MDEPEINLFGSGGDVKLAGNDLDTGEELRSQRTLRVIEVLEGFLVWVYLLPEGRRKPSPSKRDRKLVRSGEPAMPGIPFTQGVYAFQR